MTDFTAQYSFANRKTDVSVGFSLPPFDAVAAGRRVLFVCDENTLIFARRIVGKHPAGFCVLDPGEASKTWASVEKILEEALETGLDREGLIAGVGGGVVMDLAAFAASIYMRGIGLCLVPTTLLGIVDAALGGKTGFDLFGLKNLAGTFYPADRVIVPLSVLAGLPLREWKSGMAELIKTAVIDENDTFPARLRESREHLRVPPGPDRSDPSLEVLRDVIPWAMDTKGQIVEEDPLERIGRGANPRRTSPRQVLNLGHTFGHALEAAAGLGRLSHGEAVAWGMARAVELGVARGITPKKRAAEIRELLAFFDFELRAPHPLLTDDGAFFAALKADKKNRAGETVFVVPAAKGVKTLALDPETGDEMNLVRRIVSGK